MLINMTKKAKDGIDIDAAISEIDNFPDSVCIPFNSAYGQGYITNMFDGNGNEVTDPRHCQAFVAFMLTGEYEGQWVSEFMEDCQLSVVGKALN